MFSRAHKTSAWLLALSLLLAILFCALAPSPNMREMWWIPGWLGEWADRHGNFRNFPVFATFATVLVCAVTAHAPPVTRYGWLRLAFGAFITTALLGILLEAAQLFLPHRWADPIDIVWSLLGAFVGAAVACLVARCLSVC